MKICIDAGHNNSGPDTGAAGFGTREQDITFEIAKCLEEKLKKSGTYTVMTRQYKSQNLGKSTSESLKKRVQAANSGKADLFISIHCNSSLFKSASGTEVFIYSKNSKASGLADKVSKEISEKLSLKNRGVKTAAYYVLKNTNMPAMLIETAFISNREDCRKLRERAQDFAGAIFKAVTGKEEDDMPEPFKYHIEGTTHIIEADPRNIWAVETQKETNKTPYDNFVNSVFFMNQKNGKVYPKGIMVNAGKIISNNLPHGKPVSTLIIYGKDRVEMKKVSDIKQEKGVWFAVSGFGIYPCITAKEEGFTGAFSDVMRYADRPIIGYRKKDNKIVIAVRKGSTAERAKETAKNLGLDFAISLDGGGSATLKVNGSYKFKGDGRKIFGGIIWA